MGPKVIEVTPHRPSVVIETSKSVVPPKPKKIGGLSACFGILLVLHTPLWIMLTFYKEDLPDKTTIVVDKELELELEGLSSTTTMQFLRHVSRWILEFTPWFANALLCIFLGLVFLVAGFANCVFHEVTP